MMEASAPCMYVRDYESMELDMKTMGFSSRMARFFTDDSKQVAFYDFICDDSGSMSAHDGKIFENGSYRKVSRFREMCVPMYEVYSLFSKHNIPSVFETLNEGSVMIDNYSKPNIHLSQFLKVSDGGTPLCSALTRFHTHIQGIPGKKKLVICTDGESSDGDITPLILAIQRCDTSITIRLCTDNKSVLNYWNNIDKNLEVRLDIIDNYRSEAREVYEKNPRLKYNYELHRLREYGMINPLCDRLDEQRLEVADTRFLNSLISGCKSTPHMSSGCIIC